MPKCPSDASKLAQPLAKGLLLTSAALHTKTSHRIYIRLRVHYRILSISHTPGALSQIDQTEAVFVQKLEVEAA